MPAPDPEFVILVNGSELRLPAPTTVADLIGRLGLAGRKLAVERNGEIVPRSLHADISLADGDRLEVVAAVGGG